MAVTGTGTASDPWIVHNYSEIKSTIEGVNNADLTVIKYMKFPENYVYDVNNETEGFNWDSIITHWDGSQDHGCTIEFDMNGGTIKNVTLNDSVNMFRTRSVKLNFKNGKFLNIFSNNCSDMFSSDTSGRLSFYKCNFSAEISNVKANNSFSNACSFTECSMYISGSKLIANGSVFRNVKTNTITDCDIFLDVVNSNGRSVLAASANNSYISGNRWRGKYGNPPNYFLGYGSYSLSNLSTVIDLNFPNISTTAALSTGSNTGVINKSVVGGNNVVDGTMLAATTDADGNLYIKNADWLNANGFPVIEVEEGE